MYCDQKRFLKLNHTFFPYFLFLFQILRARNGFATGPADTSAAADVEDPLAVILPVLDHLGLRTWPALRKTDAASEERRSELMSAFLLIPRI